jgi:hypothetical protein
MSLLLNAKRRRTTNGDSDPYSANVLFLFKGDSSPIVDSSSSPKSTTATGSPAISSAQSKYGGSSIYLDGSSGFVFQSSADSALSIGTSDFTIEAWIYPTTISGYLGIAATGIYDAGGGFTWYFFNGKLTVYQNNEIAESGASIVANSWQHVALVRQGNTLTMFYNGNIAKINSVVGTLNIFSFGGSSGFGYNIRFNNAYFTGYIDSIRYSNIARYTTAFNPETDTYLSY